MKLRGSLNHVHLRSDSDDVPAPDDPAYLFFTSGSTGEPKGILGRYAGLCQFIAWQTATFCISAQDRVSGLTSLGFDPVLREIFLPLVNGGALCLPPADLALDEEPVWLAESGITVVHFVPSRLRAWLSAGEMCAMPRLRLAIFSGEVLHGELVESFRQFLADSCRIINFYGPTETTMVKSWFEVPNQASPGVQPIGRALWDTEIQVTDTEGRVCGAGEAGELVIRTAYASLGYLGDMRDAWRFSPDPRQPGVREISYRTGDLGCRDARGILHILGRLDHQVKINGVRIEPESVESVLASHPAVRACAVVNAPAEGEHQPGLVAWIVPVGQMPELGSLRRFLAEWLQPAAIPGVFAPLAALPILPNGKIDRAELSRRSVVQPADMHGRTAPADPTERALAAVWKSLLPAVDACREDDFFALGGNSLLGMRLINRLQLEFGVEAGLRDLFAYPSLQEMAAWLRSQHAKHAIGDAP
jgi:amino acid adenylation domain-containing protein